MSGRGKGGKGLGKGGAKRHRKVLRDNIQGARLAHFSLLVWLFASFAVTKAAALLWYCCAVAALVLV